MSVATAVNPFQVKATTGGSGGDVCPPGNHAATLLFLIDLGTHDGEYQGKARQDRVIWLGWALAEDRPNGEPFVIGQDYNLSFTDKSKLRLMIESWRGKKFSPDEQFDLMKLLGQPCLVNIANEVGKKGNPYHKIASITPLPKGMNAPGKVYEPIAFSIDMGDPPPIPSDPYLYGEPLADRIARSNERTGKTITSGPAPAKPTGPAVPDDDDTPF